MQKFVNADFGGDLSFFGEGGGESPLTGLDKTLLTWHKKRTGAQYEFGKTRDSPRDGGPHNDFKRI